jgi:hypothetical protein
MAAAGVHRMAAMLLAKRSRVIMAPLAKERVR